MHSVSVCVCEGEQMNVCVRSSVYTGAEACKCANAFSFYCGESDACKQRQGNHIPAGSGGSRDGVVAGKRE